MAMGEKVVSRTEIEAYKAIEAIKKLADNVSAPCKLSDVADVPPVVFS
jgi:hypothetical protein